MDENLTSTDLGSGSNVAPAKPKFGVGTIIRHKFLGRGRIAGYEGPNYVIYFKDETKRVPLTFVDMTPETELEDPEMATLKHAIREVLGDYGFIETSLELAPRWSGGTIKLIPAKGDIQEKEIPIEVFLKKLIGIREKLRVLEQKLNNHPKLEQEEKLDLQGYISRCYGSLTTFNVLFSDKRGQFKSSGKGEE